MAEYDNSLTDDNVNCIEDVLACIGSLLVALQARIAYTQYTQIMIPQRRRLRLKSRIISGKHLHTQPYFVVGLVHSLSVYISISRPLRV